MLLGVRTRTRARLALTRTAARFICYSSAKLYGIIRLWFTGSIHESPKVWQIGALALAVAALMALGVVVASQALAWDTPFPGFLVYRSGAVASLWRADWAGRRAGLRVRDVIVSVDGEPIAGGAALQRVLRRHRRATTRSCSTVRHPDGSPRARDACR